MYKKRLIFVGEIILIFFAGYSTAQDIQEVNFTGRILDMKGNPIAGTKVAALQMHSDGIAGNIILNQVGEVTTTGNGSFLITTPLQTKYTFLDGYIVAQKDGLTLGWISLNMQEDTDINVKLSEPQKLQGVITEQSGEPVEGAQVSVNLYRIETNSEGKQKKEWLPGMAPLQELITKTNNKGEFAFNNLPADLGVDLLVEAEGMATIYTYSAQSKGPCFKTGQTNIKINLLPEGRIAGQMVTPEANRPIAIRKFAVIPIDSKVFFYRYVCITDENGKFSIGGLRAGKYIIRGDGLENVEVEVKSGKTTDLIIRTPTLWYGRILRHDDRSPFLEPEPWPGAKIHVKYNSSKYGQLRSCIDRQGYFALPITKEEFQKLERGELEISIYYPSDTNKYVYGMVGKFPVEQLSMEKENAGVIKPFNIVTEFPLYLKSLAPPSIKGESLPDINSLTVSTTHANIGNKMILVCFFDFQQRPSRNCILQLSKRADELKAKDVTIVAVQASKVEQAKLDEWMKENEISFVVGMIESNSEKTRFNWGVKSLPWLILTDKKHVVVAEGFAINELDDKVDKTN